MSNTVIKANEVLLYGERFPISGQLRRTAATPFAPKFVIGDYTRDDQIVASSWILSSFSGGLGIEQAQLPRDADRYRYATLETRYKNLTLGAKVYTAGTLKGAADLMIEYNEYLYLTIGPNVYRWSEDIADFTLVHTLAGGGTAADVYNGELYILTQSSLHRFNSDTDAWIDYDSGTFIPSGYAMTEWDGKLFILGLNNHILWTIDPDQDDDGESIFDPLSPTPETNDWEDAGTLHLPPGYCRQLLIYFDLTGEPSIHAITRGGVYGYDFASHKFFETPLTYPITDAAGNGAIVFRGELYVPAGKTGYKYNGSTIQVISPNKDDGLPDYLQGDITSFVAGHAFYYAVLSAFSAGSTTPHAIDYFATSNPFEPFIMSESISFGSVLASPGASWHSVFNEEVGNAIGASLVASIEGTFRLWISTGSAIYYIPLDTGLHNPLHNPAATFKDTGYIETGWTDLGWSEIRKLALKLSVVCETSPTEPISIYAGWDDNDSWNLLGTVATTGQHSFNIGGIPGHVFRNVRLRIEMNSLEDDHRTPILRQVVFAFMRRPPMLWGWEMNVIFTEPLYAGKSHEELLNFLSYIAEYEKEAGEFIYRDPINGMTRRKRVVIANIQGAEESGDDAKARYTISLIQLDTPTAEEEDEFIPIY